MAGFVKPSGYRELTLSLYGSNWHTATGEESNPWQFGMQHRELGGKERVDVKDKVMGEVSKWLERFDCIVIGPGLGRDSLLLVRSSFPLL